jgi:hypothetical protein
VLVILCQISNPTARYTPRTRYIFCIFAEWAVEEIRVVYASHPEIVPQTQEDRTGTLLIILCLFQQRDILLS